MQLKASAATEENHENSGNYGNTLLHDPPSLPHTHTPSRGGLQTFWSRQEFGLRYCCGLLGYKWVSENLIKRETQNRPNISPPWLEWRRMTKRKRKRNGAHLQRFQIIVSSAQWSAQQLPGWFTQKPVLNLSAIHKSPQKCFFFFVLSWLKTPHCDDIDSKASNPLSVSIDCLYAHFNNWGICLFHSITRKLLKLKTANWRC